MGEGRVRSAGLSWVAGVLVCGAGVSAACAQSSAETAGVGTVAGKTASVGGFVEDVDGAGIAGAQVVFVGRDGAVRTLIVGADGGFRVEGLAAGGYQISVTAVGFAGSTVNGTLRADEEQELSTIVLAAGATEAVEVTVSQREVATEEVHAEEHQRLLGVIPNYFVVYDWHAPPLTTRQKFELSWKTMIDPVTLAVAAGTAGIEQATNALSGYGPGAEGYGKRLGAELADESVGTLLGGAVFPALLHQDPRYFYKGSGTVRARLFYALSTAVISKGDNGKWQPAYASVGGDLAAGAMANLYYPGTDKSGVALTFENGLLDVGLDGVQNVIQEFLLKHLTPKVPHYGAP